MYEHQNQNQIDDSKGSYYGSHVVSDYLHWRQMQSGDSVGLRLLNHDAASSKEGS
jgi:hypothetical protein